MTVQTATTVSKPAVSQAAQITISRRQAFVKNMSVLALGTVILFAVGFMSMPAAHNAAHDTRHALAFPCH